MEKLRLIAAWGILGLWVSFLVASAASKDVVVDPGLTAAALAVVTFLFGVSVVERIKKNGKNGSANGSS